MLSDPFFVLFLRFVFGLLSGNMAYYTISNKSRSLVDFLSVGI